MYKKMVYLNLFGSVFTQIISILVALILPRFIIEYYGSEINGLISSTLQIINYFALFEGGIAAAAGFELFKALKENNQSKVNGIYAAVNIFYYKVGLVILIFTILFSLVFPLGLTGIDYYKGVFIIIASSIVNNIGFLYYFKYNLIIFSDQKQYITLFSNSIMRIIATLIQVIMILNFVDVIIVISVMPILSIVRLYWIKRYTLKHYPYLNKNYIPNKKSLNQKWDAMSINVSKMLKTIVPIVFISISYGFVYSSIFTIHSMIFHIGRSIIDTTSNGLSATMGHIVAGGESDKNRKIYLLSSNIIFIINTVVSVCFLFLTSSFINIYVGIHSEISYYSPILVLTFVINEAMGNFNFTPNLLIRATGRFKETSKSAIVEIVLTILLTPLGLIIFGFQGVLIGSIISSLIRTVYVTIYCRKSILMIGYKSLFRYIITYSISFIILVFIFIFIKIEITNLKDWITYAIVVFSVSTIITLISSYVFLKDNFNSMMKLLLPKK